MADSLRKSNLPQGTKVLIKGSGLAGCMALIAFKWRWPDLDLRMTSGPPPASKTWCFHEGDVAPESWAWLTPYIASSWSGYDVHFPRHSRTLSSRYYAIRSTEFFDRVHAAFPEAFEEADADFKAELEINATGWPKVTKASHYGWQKFVGLDLKLKAGHGLDRPILKEARVEQIDGYRFFYCLPWTEKSLLIEDTYYSNTSDLDVGKIRQRIFKFAQTQGWEVEAEERMEQGALPLDMGFDQRQESNPAIGRDGNVSGSGSVAGTIRSSGPFKISIGAASGLAHPVTGYTTSTLIQQIESMVYGSDEENCDLAKLVERLLSVNEKLQDGARYFHLLNRMLFNVARPEERYIVLERFYRLSPELISRFYAGRLHWTDRARILIGRPPVPLLPAVRELSSWL